MSFLDYELNVHIGSFNATMFCEYFCVEKVMFGQRISLTFDWGFCESQGISALELAGHPDISDEIQIIRSL